MLLWLHAEGLCAEPKTATAQIMQCLQATLSRRSHSIMTSPVPEEKVLLLVICWGQASGWQMPRQICPPEALRALCCARADPGLAPAGQDSRVVGAIALMFHDRGVSLRKLRVLRPPLAAASLDYSLWLARAPPGGLAHDRAAFLWWTGVHYKLRRSACTVRPGVLPWGGATRMRCPSAWNAQHRPNPAEGSQARCHSKIVRDLRGTASTRSEGACICICRRGVAQALVAACEGLAAAAGYMDVYIQAAIILRDGSNPLGGWLGAEYKVPLVELVLYTRSGVAWHARLQRCSADGGVSVYAGCQVRIFARRLQEVHAAIVHAEGALERGRGHLCRPDV